jgi:hypothetical protein
MSDKDHNLRSRGRRINAVFMITLFLRVNNSVRHYFNRSSNLKGIAFAEARMEGVSG